MDWKAQKTNRTLADVFDTVPSTPPETGCKGYKSWTDCGYEYDCDYEFAGEITCEECMHCSYGGSMDPSKPRNN